MSQRYIFLKMASFRELREEGALYGSASAGPTRRRLSSASLPSSGRGRAPSLRHFKQSPMAVDGGRDRGDSVYSPVLWSAPSSAGSLGGRRLVGGDSYEPESTKAGDVTSNELRLLYPEEVLAADDNALGDRARSRMSKEFMFIMASLIVLLTSGGLILGFGPIYSVLVREGQWSELCDAPASAGPRPPGGVTCASQEIRLQYVFSTSFLCLSAANAFFGVFLDVAGPRMTALVGLTLSALGNFALAYGDSHTDRGGLIIAGYSLIGAGGMGSYLAAFQILQLFEVQGFVCSALSSLFNCSGYVYMLLQLDGITRSGFFLVYGVIVMTCMVVCFFLFPTNNIVLPRDTLAIPGCRLESPRWLNPLGLMDGMREELKRRDLWFFAVYFGWISLVFAFAGGAIPSILSNLAGSDAFAASLYTNYLYPLIVNGTFVYSPIVGYVIDHYGFKVIFVACLILVQVFIGLLLVGSLRTQILTFFVYAMAQACLYALQFAYIMICFPPELYGSLQAFMAIISFMFGLLNYVINPWAQMYLGGDYTIVLLALGFPTAILYCFIHMVKGCEEQTVKYDSAGNPILPSIHDDATISNEQSKLI